MTKPWLIGAILLRLNAAGWRTSMVGGWRFVVFAAIHRLTGELLVSRGPAIHAGDAARFLAQRCGVNTTTDADGA